MNKEEILKDLKKEQTTNDFTLIINKNAPNKELMILKKEHLLGTLKYYPQKDFEILNKEDNINNILNTIDELKLIDYDVVFIDNFDLEIFYLLEQYLLTFTGVKSIVITSNCRNIEGKALKEVVDRIKLEIDEKGVDCKISLFDKLLLDKNINDILEYAKEKEIDLKI